MIHLSQATNQMDKRFRLTFIAEREGMRLREFLHEKGISKRTLTATKYGGGLLLVNGTEQTVRFPLQIGDEVTVCFPPEAASEGLIAEEGPLSVLYEDDALLIIDKPPNTGTIPSRDQPSGTIANYAAGRFLSEGLPVTVHVVTRLDKDTSGVVCLAKNRHIHHLLSGQMTAGTFGRKYTAFIEGHLKEDHCIIEQPIGRKDGSIIERTVRADGQYAKTEVTVIDRFYVSGNPVSAVSLRLHTGRTHQIRVHMKWLGFPLAGDDLYGGSKKLVSRQALHCSALRFNHPLTGNSLCIGSRLPDDLNGLLPDSIKETL